MSSTSEKKIVKAIYKKVAHSDYTVTTIFDDKSKVVKGFTNSRIAKEYLKDQRSKIIHTQPTEGDIQCQQNNSKQE